MFSEDERSCIPTVPCVWHCSLHCFCLTWLCIGGIQHDNKKESYPVDVNTLAKWTRNVCIQFASGEKPQVGDASLRCFRYNRWCKDAMCLLLGLGAPERFLGGQTQNNEVTNPFVWNFRGEITHAGINFSGIWHDSRIAASSRLHHPLLSFRTPSCFFLLAVCAFPRGGKDIVGEYSAKG